MHKRRVLSLSILAGMLALLLGTFLGTTPGHAAPKTLYSSPGAYAYGVYTNIEADKLLHIGAGPLVSAYAGCSIEPKVKDEATLANLKAKDIIKTGLIESKVASERGSSSSAASAQVKITDVNLLDKMIRIKLLEGGTLSMMDAATGRSKAKSSILADIRIGDKPIKTDVAPNTKIDLDKLGYVILNEQNIVNSADETRMVLNLVHIFITTKNLLGLPIGAEIVLGHAESEVLRTEQPRLLSGSVDDIFLKAKVGSLLKEKTSPLTSTHLGCAGGLKTNHAAGVKVPGIATVGAIDEKAWGQVADKSESLSEFKAANVDLLGGLIHVDAITARAYVDMQADGQGNRQGDSDLVNLTIAGKPVNVKVGPNTRIDLAGLGYVVLNEQYGSTTNAEVQETVNALHVYINTKNTLGLEIGTELILGQASAGVVSY